MARRVRRLDYVRSDRERSSGLRPLLVVDLDGHRVQELGELLEHGRDRRQQPVREDRLRTARLQVTQLRPRRIRRRQNALPHVSHIDRSVGELRVQGRFLDLEGHLNTLPGPIPPQWIPD